MTEAKDAIKLILDCIKPQKTKRIPIKELSSYALAEDIFADRDYPPFNRATMDGYALSSKDINDKKIKNFQVQREVFAGEPQGDPVKSGFCVRIMTGAAVPDSADVVIQVELSSKTVLEGKELVSFDIDTIKTGKNIAQKGEDSVEGQVLIKKGSLSSPAVHSLLATLGIEEAKVYSPPSVAIISTGDEIIPISEKPLPYQIRDSNSYTLGAFLESYDIKPAFKALVKDNKEDLQKTIKRGLYEDILIVSGGVSMGSADFVPEILNSLGVEEVFHKVKIKPGKPLWFGHTKGTVVFGVPGNPAASYVIFKMFLEPYIRKFMHLENQPPLQIPISEEQYLKGKRDYYFPCKLVLEDGKNQLHPITTNGSGDIKAMMGSTGLGVHPSKTPYLEKGDKVEYYPWRLLW